MREYTRTRRCLYGRCTDLTAAQRVEIASDSVDAVANLVDLGDFAAAAHRNPSSRLKNLVPVDLALYTTC